MNPRPRRSLSHVLTGFQSPGLGLALCLFLLARPLLLAVDQQTLVGHIPAAVARLQPAGVLPSTTELKLAIGLPLRNTQALTNLLVQLYDPAQSNFRHFLTPDEFTQRFGPTKAQYAQVIAFARTNSLTVTATHRNRLVVDVRGTVADIERAFHTTLNSYSHPTEARSFYAPAIPPSVEAGLPILDVQGLNNFIRPHPKSLRKLPPPGPQPVPKRGSGTNGTYLGNDFRAAYLPGVALMGQGQAVGLLEFDGYYTNDIALYLSLAGLPNVPVENVLLDGFDGTPSPGPNSANNEVALDIEMAMAMAPGLTKVLVYEADPGLGNANDIISRMASDNLAAQLSCSWDFGADANATTEQIFLQFAAQGQSFFNASGDQGAYVGAVPPPDDDPYITLVGGTTLTTSTNGGAWVSETTWNSGGGVSSSGGFSATYALPSWQQGISMSANHGSTVRRNFPDVSMTADQILVVADNGQQYPIHGTSAAAPLWAGLTALVNQYAAEMGYPRAGFINPAVYALAKGPNYTSLFHDITTGNNATSTSANRYSAVAGFDLCTGWGTPAGQKLLIALAVPDTLGVVPVTGLNANGPAAGPFTAMSQTFSLTNSSGASLDWALGNPAPWLDASPASGTLSPGQTATVTVGFNPAAFGLPAGTYSTNLFFTNLASQVVQSRRFTLSIGSSLVLNGDFESGDFAYWTLTGSSADSYCFVDNGSSITPHAGAYAAAMGEPGTLATLTQPLPTLPGQPYLLSFWFTSVPDPNNSTTPNELRVQFDDHVVFDAVNLGILDWTNVQTLVSASSSTTALEFDCQDDPGFIGLDDISVVPVPAPTFHSVTRENGTIQLGWAAFPGLSYQVQYSTNLTQSHWVNLGPPIVAAGATAGAADPAGPDPARFYRVILRP